MTPEPYDFRKPAPLPPSLRTPLAGWLPQVCLRTSRQWATQVPFAVEMESRGLGVLPASNVFDTIPDTALRFRAAQVGTSDVSLLAVPRPLMLALLAGLLGESLDPDAPDRELTTVEESVSDYVAQQFFLDPLQQTWPLPRKLKLEPPRREPPRSAPTYLPTTLLLVAQFHVRGPFGELDWWWVLPRSGWVESLTGGPQAQTAPPNREERENLVRELPLLLTVQLGATRMSLLHLAALEVGDVLLLEQPVDQPMPARLGGQVKFLVWPGAVGTRQAVAIHTTVES